MDVGKPEVAPLETEGQLRVIEAEQMQDGRVQIVHVNAVLDDVEPPASHMVKACG